MSVPCVIELLFSTSAGQPVEHSPRRRPHHSQLMRPRLLARFVRAPLCAGSARLRGVHHHLEFECVGSTNVLEAHSERRVQELVASDLQVDGAGQFCALQGGARPATSCRGSGRSSTPNCCMMRTAPTKQQAPDTVAVRNFEEAAFGGFLLETRRDINQQSSAPTDSGLVRRAKG